MQCGLVEISMRRLCFFRWRVFGGNAGDDVGLGG